MLNTMSDPKLTDYDDVKITPEMVEAGVKAFFPFDRRYDEIDDALKRVWRAMWMALLEGQAAPGNWSPPRR